MFIISIKSLPNGAHSNQYSERDIPLPDGWAVVPERVGTPDTLEHFPFGEITVEETEGVPTVTGWTPLPIPEPDSQATPSNRTEALAAVNQKSFSLEERRIGTWIDGSALYSRTFIGKFPMVPEVYSQIIEWPLCFPKSSEVRLFNADNGLIPLPFADYVTPGSVGIIVGSDGLKIAPANQDVIDLWGGAEVCATIEYTKLEAVLDGGEIVSDSDTGKEE